MADDVIRAVLLSHDPTASDEDRNRAYALLERFKSSPGESVRVSTALVRHPDPRVQHFAFHSLEILVKAGWNSLNEKQKEDLKVYAFELFKYSEELKQNFLREKVCDFITQIALRDWPQRWSKMLPTAFEMAGVGKQGERVVLSFILTMTIRNLASQIIAFDPNVPEKRCREIQEGLKDSMAAIRYLIMSTLSRYLGKGESQTSETTRAISLTLDAIKAVADWVDPAFFFGLDGKQEEMKSGPLPMIFEAYRKAEFCVVAGEILEIICQKNTMPKYFGIIYQMWIPVLSTNEQLLKIKIDDVAHWTTLMLAVSGPLHKLTRNHLKLIAEPDNKKIRFRLFSLILQLTKHRVLSVSKLGTEMWMFLFRYKWDKMMDDEWKKQISSEVITACIKNNEKLPWDGSSSEFDTQLQHNNSFAGLRSQIQCLMGLITAKAPGLVLEKLARAYTDVLGKTHEMLSKNPSGRAIGQANIFLESLSAILEHTIRAIPKDFHSDRIILECLGGILRAFLLFKKAPMTLLAYKMHAMGVLHPLYRNNSEALQAAVTELIRGVQSTPEGKRFDRNDKDTLIARKRALQGLISISKKHQQNLVTHFKSLSDLVSKAISQADLLRDEDRMGFLEFLIPISNAMNERAQMQFLKSIASEPVNKWDRLVSQALKNTQIFVKATGLHNIEAMGTAEARKNRQDLWWCIDLMRAMFRHTAHRRSLNIVTLLLTPQRLNALLILARCCNQLLSPRMIASMSPEMAAALAETREEMEEMSRKLPRGYNLVKEVHVWYRTIRACTYNLLGVAAKEIPQVFYEVAPASRLGTTAFECLPTMPPLYLKVILDQLLPQFLTSYPLKNREQARVFQGALGEILSGLFSRLGRGWAEHQYTEFKNSHGSEKDEIRSSSALVNATRAFVNCLCSMVTVPQGIAGISFVRNFFYPPSAISGSNNPIQDEKKGMTERKKTMERNPYVPSKMEIARSNMIVEIILADTNLFQLVMTVLTALIIWPHSASCVTACTLVVRFIPAIVKSRQRLRAYAPSIIQIFEAALKVLSRLSKELEEAQHGALVNMNKEIYCNLVPIGLGELQKILERIPGVDISELRRVENTIVKAAGEKTQKKAFKNFIFRHVVGRQVDAGRRFSVQDLPESFVASCKDLSARRDKYRNRGKSDDDDDGKGFEWIFSR